MGRGHLVFRKDRCKGCELCIEVCPQDILTLDMGHVNVRDYHPITCIDEGSCTGCANCSLVCPDGVINVYLKEGNDD